MHSRIRLIDKHTRAAVHVTDTEYFVIARTSENQNLGLLVGTEVKKIGEPLGRKSKFYRDNQKYWTVKVLCPNGEERTICCDVLEPRQDSSLFTVQKLCFNRSISKLIISKTIIANCEKKEKNVANCEIVA